VTELVERRCRDCHVLYLDYASVTYPLCESCSDRHELELATEEAANRAGGGQ